MHRSSCPMNSAPGTEKKKEKKNRLREAADAIQTKLKGILLLTFATSQCNRIRSIPL